MAISPPSDLVLDVVRAADPADVQAAQARLKANRATFAATSLAEKGAGFGAAVEMFDSAEQRAGVGNVRNIETKDIPESYRKFEAVVLQNFVKSMLPTESEDVYGKGAAGDIWKGMMAEQFGDVLSKNGGIGIAEQMFKESLSRARNKEVNNASASQDDRNLAIGMITDFERRTLGVSAAEDKKSAKL